MRLPLQGLLLCTISYRSLSQIISTVAGTGSASDNGDGIAATSAALNPYGVAFDSYDDLYIGDAWNNRVRKVNMSTGIITTYAGTGVGSHSGDGRAATLASLNIPFGLSFDSSNNLFIADHVNNRVRRVDYNSKNITTVAGNGATGADGDEGPATSANLGYPCGVIVDSNSSYLYISQVYDHKIRRVSLSTYVISTLAGTGSAIFSGDDGLAILASINQPHQMTFDRHGDMYVTDTGSNRIRKIAATTSIISTVVGTGDKGYSGDGGAATSAMLNYPSGAHINRIDGLLYIGDYDNCRLRRVSREGNISTIAGTATCSFSGEGVEATSASLCKVIEVASNSKGDVYFVDSENSKRVRKLSMNYGTPTAVPTRTPTATPTASPTATPTVSPTVAPTATPTVSPTVAPSATPTASPTVAPTATPTASPTVAPTATPTVSPTAAPTATPTVSPTVAPTATPTVSPTVAPTATPTVSPTAAPTATPTVSPTVAPSFHPTSQPSSSPTSRPSRRDLRTSSILTGDVDAEFVWFKIDYFLAAYVAYFVLLNLVSFLVDYSEWCGETIDGLTQGACASEHYCRLVTVDEKARPGEDGLRSLLMWRIIAADEEWVVKHRQHEASGAAASPADVESGKAGYDSEFYRFLLIKRTKIGCKPELFPYGYDFFLFNVETRGLLEDLLVYLLNYHKILSTMFSIRGLPHYSRLDRRVVFTMQHVACLSVLALVDDIFRAAGVSSDSAGLFTLLVIPTLSIALSVLFRAIVMSMTMHKKGRVAMLVVFSIGAMCLLVFAAMATSTVGRLDLISAYTVKVFVVSSLQELLLILLLFYHRMYFAVYVGRFPVLMVGRYFLERLLSSSNCEQASGDIVCKTHSLLELVTVEWAYSRTQTLMAAAAAAAPHASSRKTASMSFASTYGPSGDRIDELQMTSLFTNNPLNDRIAAADLLQISSSAASIGDSSARDSASHHTAMLTAAHSMEGAVNPLLLPRPAVLSARAQTAVEETDDSDCGARFGSTSHDGGDRYDEALSLQLRRFASPVTRDYRHKVHFFQALEQGAIDQCGANVESTDMEMIEQLGGGELQGELLHTGE